MSEMSIAVIILFGALVITMLGGIPVAFSMAGVSLVVSLMLGGFSNWSTFVSSNFNLVQNLTYTAIPLYIFMAAILRYSDLADDLYEMMYRWFGGIRGGLGAGTVIISTLFAAMVGLTSVATATLGVSALPSMQRRGYDDKLTSGIIIGGACIGIIIPPSVVMLIYASVTGVSPGKMFMAGIIPGLMIMVFLIIYSLVYCYIKPEAGPALPKEDRFSMKEKMQSLKGVILPLLLIICVIGSILMGFATPTEAASVGVVGSLICAALKGRLTFTTIKQMIGMTVGLSSSVFWLIMGSTAYARVTSLTKIGIAISNWVGSLDVNRYLILLVIVVFFFIVGMFMDASAGLFMSAPILLPLLTLLEFDLLWFGLIYVILVAVGNMTPPFGICLFVLRGVAPTVPMKTIMRSVMPFVVIYLLFIVLFTIFPQFITWLPSVM